MKWELGTGIADQIPVPYSVHFQILKLTLHYNKELETGSCDQFPVPSSLFLIVPSFKFIKSDHEVGNIELGTVIRVLLARSQVPILYNFTF